MSEQGENVKEALANVTISDVFGFGKAANSPAGKAISDAFATRIIDIIQSFIDPARIAISGAVGRRELRKNIEQIDRLIDADPEIIEQIKIRLITAELSRQSNINNAYREAIDIADAQSSSADEIHKIDLDFITEWIDGVKDVSDETVRRFWAEILAKTPVTKEGRVTKPSLELLRSFDSKTAIMFAEFVKISSIVGGISARVSDKWAPLGEDVDFQFLSDIGIIRNDAWYPELDLPHLGAVRKPQGQLNPARVFCWTFRPRALELAKVIFDGNFQYSDDEQTLSMILQNTVWIFEDHYPYTILTTREGVTYNIPNNSAKLSARPVDLGEITANVSLDSIAKYVLGHYASQERLYAPDVK